MKMDAAVFTKPSEAEEVDVYVRKLDHPLADVVGALRKVILAADPEIGEEIKWNAPTFFFTGRMKPSDPKEYKRYIVVSNLYRRDCIRLVFPSGAKVGDRSGLLEGDYADGRRLAYFRSVREVRAKTKALKTILCRWLELVERA